MNINWFCMGNAIVRRQWMAQGVDQTEPGQGKGTARQEGSLQHVHGCFLIPAESDPSIETVEKIRDMYEKHACDGLIVLSLSWTPVPSPRFPAHARKMS